MRKIALLALLSVAACAGPYSNEPETVPLPKPKKNAKGPVTGPAEPDTCRTTFDGPPVAMPKKNHREQAKSYAQDADNQLSGVDSADYAKRRHMVLAALSTLHDALKMDPYSAAATYEMAVAYAAVGKKKCAVALLTRLNDLGTAVPDLVPEISKLKQKAKNDPSFDNMRKEADAALP